jgi:hypothetical protein
MGLLVVCVVAVFAVLLFTKASTTIVNIEPWVLDTLGSAHYTLENFRAKNTTDTLIESLRQISFFLSSMTDTVETGAATFTWGRIQKMMNIVLFPDKQEEGDE